MVGNSNRTTDPPIVFDLAQSTTTNPLDRSHDGDIPAINDILSVSKISSTRSSRRELKANFATLLETDEVDIVREQIDRIASDSDIITMDEVRQKNFCERLFRPMGPGSIRGSSLTLISGCAGVGMLG